MQVGAGCGEHHIHSGQVRQTAQADQLAAQALQLVGIGCAARFAPVGVGEAAAQRFGGGEPVRGNGRGRGRAEIRRPGIGTCRTTVAAAGGHRIERQTNIPALGEHDLGGGQGQFDRLMGGPSDGV